MSEGCFVGRTAHIVCWQHVKVVEVGPHKTLRVEPQERIYYTAEEAQRLVKDLESRGVLPFVRQVTRCK